MKLCISALVMILLVLFSVVPALAETYYISPTGLFSNNGLTPATAFTPQRFQQVHQPGDTLIALTGTYTGSANMLNFYPTAQAGWGNLNGTSGAPITIKCEQDGGCRINGGGTLRPVVLGGNWIIFEGFNVSSSSGSVLSTRGKNMTIRRSIAWDAKDCSATEACGQTGVSGPDEMVIDTVSSENVTVEDSAGFGVGRKPFQCQASKNCVGRRVFAVTDGYNSIYSQPREGVMLGYHTEGVLVENVISYWTKEYSTVGHNNANFTMDGPDDNTNGGQRYFGNISILPCSASTAVSTAIDTSGPSPSTIIVQDQLNLYQAGCWTSLSPPNNYGFRTVTQSPNVGSTATRVSTIGGPGNVGSGANVVGTGWSSSGFCATGYSTVGNFGSCTSPFNESGTNARICKRTVNGVLTPDKLFPWPMDQRIKDARAAAGRSALPGDGTVTGMIETMLGTIPAACKGAGPPDPEPTQDKVQFIGSDLESSNSVTSKTIPLVSGVIVDDLIQLVCVSRADGTTAFTSPGYSHIAGSPLNRNVGSNDMTLAVLRKFAATSEPAPVVTASTASGGWSCTSMVHRFVNKTTPDDVAPTTTSVGAGTTVIPTAITTANAQAKVMSIIVGGGATPVTLQTGQGFTAKVSGGAVQIGYAPGHVAGMAELEKTTAGVVTMPTWAYGTSVESIGFTLALRWNGTNSGVTPPIPSGSTILGMSQIKPMTQIRPMTQVKSRQRRFPSSPVLDTFDRVNEGPPPSASWTNTTGLGLKVLGNQLASANATTFHGAKWNTVYGADQEVYAELGTTPPVTNDFVIATLVWRQSADITSFYELQLKTQTGTANDTIVVNRWSGGVWAATVLSDTFIGADWAAGQGIGVRMMGAAIEVYFRPVDGLWTLLATATDPVITTGGTFMITLVEDRVRFDNFGGGVVGGIATLMPIWYAGFPVVFGLVLLVFILTGCTALWGPAQQSLCDQFCIATLNQGSLLVKSGQPVSYVWCTNVVGTWVGTFPVGAPDTKAARINWAYVDCSPIKSGNIVRNGLCALPAPAQPGRYEQRLYPGDPTAITFPPPQGRGQPYTVVNP